MAQVLKCRFNNVNGDNTGVWTRTGPSKSYPSPGILYKKNCPDELHFYCDPNGAQNTYYKLLNPEKYKIDSSKGTVYVPLSTSYLTKWELVDDSTMNTNNKTQTATTSSSNKATVTTTANTSLGKSTEDGIITDATPSVISDDITKYISYTANSIGPNHNYSTDYSSFKSDIDTIEKNLNIGISAANVAAMKNDTMYRFNRFLIGFPNSALSKTFAHVFFTRPELNLYSNKTLLPTVANDPFFYYMDKNSPALLKSLTRDFSSVHDFNPFLSNKAGSFTLKDEYIETEEYGETFTGWKMKYGRNNIKSKTADNFEIEYTEDNNYNILKIHKAWIDYISKVYRGEFSPKRESITTRTIDYACSVYFFLCGPDGETLLFWSKYTGVFPTNIPSTAANWTKGDIMKMPKISINYEYSWKEDMMPTTLAEFNLNSAKEKSTTYAKTYEPTLASTGKTYVGTPFVEMVENPATNTYEYKLRFRK